MSQVSFFYFSCSKHHFSTPDPEVARRHQAQDVALEAGSKLNVEWD